MITIVNPDLKNNMLYVDILTSIMVYNSLSDTEKTEFIEYIISNDKDNLIVDKRILKQILREQQLQHIINKL